MAIPNPMRLLVLLSFILVHNISPANILCESVFEENISQWRGSSTDFLRFLHQWNFMSLSGEISTDQIHSWPPLKRQIFYTDLFTATFLNQSLDNVNISTISKLTKSSPMTPHRFFSEVVQFMLQDPSFSNDQKLNYIYKILIALKRTGQKAEQMLFDLGILNNVLFFASTSLHDTHFQQFHDFLVRSPSRDLLHLSFQTLRQVYLSEQVLLPLATSALEHDHVLLTTEDFTVLEIESLMSHEGFDLYFQRAAKNKLNRDIESLALVQNRINRLIFLRYSFGKGVHLSSENSDLNKLYQILFTQTDLAIIKAHALLVLEFGFVPTIQTTVLESNNGPLIPKVELQLANNQLRINSSRSLP